MAALRIGDSGPYGRLVMRPLPDGLTLVFVPSLAALLTRALELNGTALTEAQVLRIRNGANVVVADHDQARAVEEKRGYADIDAVDAWQGWVRLQPGRG